MGAEYFVCQDLWWLHQGDDAGISLPRRPPEMKKMPDSEYNASVADLNSRLIVLTPVINIRDRTYASIPDYCPNRLNWAIFQENRHRMPGNKPF